MSLRLTQIIFGALGAVPALSAALAIAGSPTPPEFDGLQQVENFWISHGAPLQVAKAWAAEVDRESGGDPTTVGDGGTSLGAYQHHNDRAKTLLLNIENNQAFQELMGDDPIAAAHRDEIMNAPTEAAARTAIKNFFFRPAGSPRPTQVNRPQHPAAVATRSSVVPAADVSLTSSDPFSSAEHDPDSSFLITQEKN